MLITQGHIWSGGDPSYGQCPIELGQCEAAQPAFSGVTGAAYF